MIVKLLTEHHLEFLSFKGGCTGSTTLVKMPHCWKSDVTGHIQITIGLNIFISQIDTYMYNSYKHYK